jgi:hypothetical protein
VADGARRVCVRCVRETSATIVMDWFLERAGGVKRFV